MADLVKLVLVVALGVAAWQFFTGPPSTADVCYTWSKATDPYLNDEFGIDGAQWLRDNIKTEDDLNDLDKNVRSALKLYYDAGPIVADDPYDTLQIRKFVLDACEKASPGSTKH
jgi:hypothetical protein